MCKKLLNPPILTLLVVVCGCGSPFQKPAISNKELRIDTTLMASVIAEAETPLEFPLRGETAVEAELAGRRAELDALSPAVMGKTGDLDLSTTLSAQDVIMLTIENNLDIEIASIQPTISAQAIVEAESAFDFIFGSTASLGRNRTPQQNLPGNPFSSNEQASDTFGLDAQLARQLSSGGTLTFSTEVTETDNQTSDFVFTPNPAWNTSGSLTLNQPLMRNFGKPAATSQINISKLVYGQALEEFKLSLIDTVTSADLAYLDLTLQWKILEVKEWLLNQGEQVVKILDFRRSYDTGEADYAQAVATVQQRRVDFISQKAIVHAASDKLKEFLNSQKFSIDSPKAIEPSTELNPGTIKISLQEAAVTAVANSPTMQSLALGIDAEEIRLQLADNARLPQLDLRAQMSLGGLGDSASSGYQEVVDADFINYITSLTFEVPLGNRGAEAKYEVQRLQKLSSVAAYRKGVQQTILAVKEALRNIATNAELMKANRSYRVAQAENLRALLIEEQTMSGLTPTFLSLKLQTQSGLASARISEFTATASFNKAISTLYKVMGTTLKMHQVAINPTQNHK